MIYYGTTPSSGLGANGDSFVNGAGGVVLVKEAGAWVQKSTFTPFAASAPTAPLPYQYPDGSRRVWLHKMLQLPTYQLSPPYGANYPLAMRSTYSSALRPQDTADLYLNAGITGIQLLYGDESQDMTGQISSLFALCDGTALECCPCLAVTTTAGSLAQIDAYLALAASHPSAAKVVIAGVPYYIVSIYGARYGHPASFWTDFKTQCAQNGRKVFLLADIGTNISGNGFFDPTVVESFATASQVAYSSTTLFDAAWTFDDGVDIDWTNLDTFRQSVPQKWAGGMLPAYNRESVSTGGYSDAEATAKYRRQWSYAIASGLQWNHVVTWNDVAERSDIWPSSEWHYTRADITAFYSALMRKAAFPTQLATPQLYVTVPQRMNVGQAASYAEALVLNTSTSPVTVRAQLIDGAGTALGKMVFATVQPQTAGAAVVRAAFTSLPGSNTYPWARLVASSYDRSGALLQTVTSAPICVYSAGQELPDFRASRVKYNSISARLALPGVVTLTIPGVPYNAPTTATVVPPAGTVVRFSDVLQNGYATTTVIDPTGPQIVTIPAANGQANAAIGTVATGNGGFYVGRVIDSQERVGYSDPKPF